MHRKHLLILGAGALLISAAAWAKPQLTTDAAHGVNFAAYKTYSWASTQPQGGVNSVRYQRVLSHVDGLLHGKGYTQHSPGDLTLALTVGRRQRVDLDRWNHYGYHTDYAYNEGQISLDAFDAKTKKAVWHGQVTDSINPNKPDPEKLQAAVNELLDHFPAH